MKLLTEAHHKSDRTDKRQFLSENALLCEETSLKVSLNMCAVN